MQKIHKENVPTCKISFYTVLSIEKAQLNDLIKLAKRRLTIYRSLESLKDIRIIDLDAKDDELSHFACRLVCCSIPWAYTWFLANEIKFMKLRLNMLPLSEIKHFFYTILLKKMKNLVLENDVIFINENCYFSPDNEDVNFISDIYEVRIHFMKVPEILGKGRATFSNGYMNVRDNHLSTIISSEYSDYLNHQMKILKNNPYLKNDERFRSISNDLLCEPVKMTNQLNTIIEKSPLCILFIIERMKKEKHLKFNDRQILIRFFKDAGLKVNECIEFFRNNFSCDPVRFEREFVYSIRHNYGLEGKRANYKTFTCLQIVKMGFCPFKSKDVCEFVRQKNFGDIEDTIKEEIKSFSFTKACTKYLERAYDKSEMQIVNTPIDYFIKSGLSE